ncbi:MAG: hypothetical protein Q4C46_05695 [Bacillota bacterium]|nr:hypothetical protein [Bacillota bacterium]
MFISKGLIIFIVLIGIYYLWKHNKTNRLSKYMQELPRNKEMIYIKLQKQTEKHELLAKGFDNIFPIFVENINGIYASTGSFNDGSPQYLYSICKGNTSYNFTCIALFRFINRYINDHPYDLSTYKDGIRYKTDFCKELDELYLCTAKECIGFKNIEKYASIHLDLIKRYVDSDTIKIIKL